MPASHDAHAPYTPIENSWLCATAMRCLRKAPASARADAGDNGRSIVQYSTVTPDPVNCRSSQPSPSLGTKTTVSRPDACSAVETSATTLSAPPGPSVLIS
jgi:hypothetical protein